MIKKFKKIKSAKTIKCVDLDGNIIINLALWRKSNSKRLYFESEFERQAYLLFKKANLNFVFQPDTRVLIPTMETWALSKGKTKKLFKSTVRPISYTSDFAIYCDNGYTIFVETKGFFHKDARIRYKLFQHTLTNKEMSLLAFDTYNLKGQDRMTDIKIIIKIIQNDFNKKELSNTIDI